MPKNKPVRIVIDTNSGKWNLAPTTDDYVHSSSRYYPDGIQGIFPVDSIMEVLNIELSKKN